LPAATTKMESTSFCRLWVYSSYEHAFNCSLSIALRVNSYLQYS
jgi:hypothetical protein